MQLLRLLHVQLFPNRTRIHVITYTYQPPAASPICDFHVSVYVAWPAGPIATLRVCLCTFVLLQERTGAKPKYI